GPEEAAAISERRTLVRSALETLSPPQREVIELAYYSGLSHSEIAAHLGQPLGTVKTRARLGMMKLCEMLRPLGREQKARGERGGREDFESQPDYRGNSGKSQIVGGGWD